MTPASTAAVTWSEVALLCGATRLASASQKHEGADREGRDCDRPALERGEEGGEPRDDRQGIGEADVKALGREHRADDEHGMSDERPAAQQRRGQAQAPGGRAAGRGQAHPFESCRSEVGGRDQQVE